MSDATARIRKDLDNPSLYYKVAAVPIFVPHTRKKRSANGQVVEVEVTIDDLKEIAEHNNRRKTLAQITLGHRTQTPDFSENKQPLVVGFCKNWRVGKFGPGQEPVLFYDEYVRLADKEVVGQQYPHRSADYYPGLQEISGVAALKRDAELDLGTIVYAGGQGLLRYSREVQYMADPTMPPDPDMSAADPSGDNIDPSMDDIDPSGDDMQQREQYERHCASHPYARKHHEKMLSYAMEAGGGAPPAMPGATDMAPPAAAKEPPMPFARSADAVAYARTQKELQELKAKLDKVEKEREAALHAAMMLQYRSELEELQSPSGGGYLFDIEEELPLCTNYSRADMDAHKARLIKICKQDPTAGSGFIQVARTNGKPPKLDEKRLDEALTYARANGCSVDEAVKKVLAK